jgi:Domain of Unknown Function (DUF1206)
MSIARKMVATAPRSADRGVPSPGREAASSQWMVWLARAGLTARGVNYLLIGALAVAIGLGNRGKEADRLGALRYVAGKPGGAAGLWLLAVGFAALTVWRLAEAAYGQSGPDGHKARKRLGSLASAVLYGFICGSIVTVLLGVRQTSGNSQSKDVTAQLMAHTGGRWLVLAIGVGVVVAGIVIIIGAVRKTFAKQLRLTEMSRGTRHVMETLGRVGGTARGIVFCVVGVFLIVAAATFDANKAQGLDGALRKIAETPLGPWLLVAVALGLVTFGVYSCCEARWRKVRPG